MLSDMAASQSSPSSHSQGEGGQAGKRGLLPRVPRISDAGRPLTTCDYQYGTLQVFIKGRSEVWAGPGPAAGPNQPTVDRRQTRGTLPPPTAACHRNPGLQAPASACLARSLLLLACHALLLICGARLACSPTLPSVNVQAGWLSTAHVCRTA